MDGLSSTHLGTRFWITSDTEGVKKLGKVENAPTEKVELKKITAKSERIFSLAQDGISGRFSNVLNSAKLFGERINAYRCQNLETLKICLAGTEDEFNQLDTIENYDNFFTRRLDAMVDKIGKINGVGENFGSAEIVQLIHIMCDTKDFAAFAAEYEGGLPDARERENYIASLMNATAGALKLIKEHKLTAGSILELDKGRIYDLSREYDMYEVAYKAYKMVAHEVDMPYFDVGDGSAKTLKNKLRDIKTKLETKLVQNFNDINQDVREALRSTINQIKCCLNRGFKIRNEDRFYADAHKVLDPLMAKCGKRSVDVKIRASGSFGVLADLAKVEVAGSYTYQTTIEKTLDGYKLTVNHKGSIDGSLSAKAGFASGDKTGKPEGEKVQGLQAKVGGNIDVGGGTSKVFATLDDLIAELGDNAEIVCAGKKSLGILGGIGRAVRGAWRKFWYGRTKDSEFDARKCLSDLKKVNALNKLDDVVSRREVGLKISSRSSLKLGGGINASLSANFGLSRGKGSDDKYDDVRLVDANISGSGSIAFETNVVQENYRSITKQMMLRSDSGLREKLDDNTEYNRVINMDADEAIDALKSLQADLLKAEDAATEKGDDRKRNFVSEWTKLAAKAEILMRKIPTDTQDKTVNEKNLAIKALIVDRLDHPRLHEGEEILNELNARASTGKTGTRTYTVQLDLSYDVGSGANEFVDDKLKLPDGLGKTAADGALKLGAESIKAGFNQISPLPAKMHFGVTGTLTTLNDDNPALPWDGIEVMNMSVKFSPNMPLQKVIEKLYEANTKICAKAKNENNGKELKIAAKDKFVNDLLSNLGVTATDSVLGTAIGKLLKDKALDPKAAAAFSIDNEVSLSLTYHDGVLVSFGQSRSETTASSIGGEVTVPLFGADVTVGLKCSESITESVSTRFRVGAMPIDSVLANISKYSGLTCRELTKNYLSSNKASALRLLKEVLDSVRAQREEQVGLNVLTTSKLRLDTVKRYLRDKANSTNSYFERVRDLFNLALNKLENLVNNRYQDTDPRQLDDNLINTLADYLIAVNQVYTYKKEHA